MSDRALEILAELVGNPELLLELQDQLPVCLQPWHRLNFRCPAPWDGYARRRGDKTFSEVIGCEGEPETFYYQVSLTGSGYASKRECSSLEDGMAKADADLLSQGFVLA